MYFLDEKTNKPYPYQAERRQAKPMQTKETTMTHNDELAQIIWERDLRMLEDNEEKVFSVREFMILAKELKICRAKTKEDKKFLAIMVKAWDTIEEEMDTEILKLKDRIADLEESAEAHADADQARAMAKAENDEWRERELSEDFHRKMEW